MSAVRAMVAALLLIPASVVAADTPPPVRISVSHVGISVSDMARSVAFFRDVLGASVTEPKAYPNASSDVTGTADASIIIAMATLGAQRFELIQYVRPKGAPSRLGPHDPGHVHIGVVVQDFAAMRERLRAAGFVSRVPPKSDGARPRPVYLYGFDGLVIELIAAR